jgi:polar amino acid transport system substrate-binding protein
MEFEMACTLSSRFVVRLTLILVAGLAAGLGILASTQAAGANSLEKILQTKKIVVGTEAAMPPFEFVQDGKIVGYGKDILDQLVKDMGVELEQINLPWQGILPGLTAKKFDLVATSVTITQERAQKFAFTMPIAEGTYHAIRRKADTSIKTPDDLSGKVVGAQLGSASESAVKAFDAKLKAAGKPGLKDIKLYISYPEMYLGLANGEIDAGVHSLPSLIVLMKERPGLYELVGPVREKSYYAWLTRPEDTALRDAVDMHLKAMQVSGFLYQLQEKWFGFRMELPTSDYIPEGGL